MSVTLVQTVVDEWFSSQEGGAQLSVQAFRRTGEQPVVKVFAHRTGPLLTLSPQQVEELIVLLQLAKAQAGKDPDAGQADERGASATVVDSK